MRTLGIDPSLRAYGWCIYDSSPGITPRSRRVASGHDGTISSMVPVTRFIHFRSLVRSLLTKFPTVELVGIESPAYGGGPFSETHFGLMMFSLEAVFERRIDCVLFDPTTLKKITTGNAKAGKMDMQRFVQIDTMDTKAINNDEADAYCVARFSTRFKLLLQGELSPDALSEEEKVTFLTKTKKKVSSTGIPVIKKTAHVFRENSRYFSFSRVPVGNVDLPQKSQINPSLLQWLESE